MRQCATCGCSIEKRHHNAIRCVSCAKEKKRRPIGRLTPAQERKARSLAGRLYFDEVASRVGCSRSNLRRWAREHPEINFNAHKYPEHLVMEVCQYYAEHGKIKTQDRYPQVKVRSIVERYSASLSFEPRQVRWKGGQLVELAKMAGIVNAFDQAAYFNRPNAHAGSIKSAWNKVFGYRGQNINGISWYLAKEYVRPGCPYLAVDYQRIGPQLRPRKLVLWVDLEKHMRADVPDHLRQAIKALAKFQRWLHGRNARANISKLIEEVCSDEKPARKSRRQSKRAL